MLLMGSSPAGDRLHMDSNRQTHFASRFPGLAHPYRPAPQLGLCGLIQPACLSFFHPLTYHKNTDTAICFVAGLIRPFGFADRRFDALTLRAIESGEANGIRTRTRAFTEPDAANYIMASI